jgi:hypothetical protein
MENHEASTSSDISSCHRYITQDDITQTVNDTDSKLEITDNSKHTEEPRHILEDTDKSEVRRYYWKRKVKKSHLLKRNQKEGRNGNVQQPENNPMQNWVGGKVQLQ